MTALHLVADGSDGGVGVRRRYRQSHPEFTPAQGDPVKPGTSYRSVRVVPSNRRARWERLWIRDAASSRRGGSAASARVCSGPQATDGHIPTST